jgi:ABC-type transporter Mla MlaB component
VKIPFEDLGMIELESFHSKLLESVNKKDKKIELDFCEVSRIGLCAIQLLISFKKYCDEFDIEIEFKNIESSQLKTIFKVYNLDDILGIK